MNGRETLARLQGDTAGVHGRVSSTSKCQPAHGAAGIRESAQPRRRRHVDVDRLRRHARETAAPGRSGSTLPPRSASRKPMCTSVRRGFTSPTAHLPNSARSRGTMAASRRGERLPACRSQPSPKLARGQACVRLDAGHARRRVVARRDATAHHGSVAVRREQRRLVVSEAGPGLAPGDRGRSACRRPSCPLSFTDVRSRMTVASLESRSAVGRRC